MTRFSNEFLTELRERNDIESVVSPYVRLKRSGKLSKGLCPFHNEKTPSFTVFHDTNSYYCFGCGSGGDPVSFIMKIENLSYPDAVKYLVQRCGMKMPEDSYDDAVTRLRQRILSANREAARFFHNMLLSPDGKAGLDYFTGRGLTMQTLNHFGLGFAPDRWDALLGHMRSLGYTLNELYEANLIKKSEKNGRVHYYDNFRNRAIIPIIDLQGNVIAFGGRVLDDSKPKYINTSDTLVYKKSKGVFALNFAKNGNPSSLIVAEGYMDVIALHQAGFTNSVACLGTALTVEQARLVSRYSEEVILSYDSDEAGQKATRRAIEIFSSTGLKIRVLKLTGGKDPDEIIKKYGKEKFRGLIDGAANQIEYAILNERRKYDLETIDGRTKFLTAVAGILADCNPIEQDAYASKLGSEMGISKDAILSEIKKAHRRKTSESEKKHYKTIAEKALYTTDRLNPEATNYPKETKAEEVLLSALFNNPDFYRKLKGKLSEDLFITELNRRFFKSLSEKIENNCSIELSAFSEEFNPDEMGRLTKLSLRSTMLSNTIKECEDCIDVLRKAGSRPGTNVEELSDEEFRKLFDKKE